MVKFVVVFDLFDAGYPGWGAVLIGVAVVIVAFLGAVFRKSFVQRLLASCFAVLLGLLLVVGTILNLSFYCKCRSILRQGKANYVEGVVEDCKLLPRGYHGVESFSVKSGRFCLHDANFSSIGYDRQSRSGGPIRTGQYVRIWYYEGSILRLEIQQTGQAQ